ncbi:MAG: signal recognition particle-docking protein FtsY [Marinicaulis sp.]|nr:signal recognition particle-docking protein FtsY [Marinicaulis sp.]
MAKNFLSGLFKKKDDNEDAESTQVSAPEAPAELPAEPPEPEQPLPQEQPEIEADTPSTEQSVVRAPAQKQNWYDRLKQGLSKSSSRLSDGVSSIFAKRKLDDETLEELEELLISADLGVPATTRITSALAQEKFDKEITDNEVRAAVAAEIATTLSPKEKSLAPSPMNKPHVILMIGVNGAGKTTTIGKLAHKFKDDGQSVMLAAGDTFRAAAIEQLTVWGERTRTPVVSREVGADAAGLAFDALTSARENQTDVLIIDTAGRLQNKTELMDELAKIVRVLKKIDPAAPHDVVLVLDATVGQNAISQAQAFSETAGVTGMVMTKLDGTARGGVLVALADRFDIPVHYIGVGENVEDLQPFRASEFANALAGVVAS